MTDNAEESGPVTGAGSNSEPAIHEQSAMSSQSTRSATIRTTHEAPSVVAAALRPDHTDALRTRVVSRTDRGAKEREDSGNSIEERKAGNLRSEFEQPMDVTPNQGTVVTTIERPSTTGLAATVDDYLVNCLVADRVSAIVNRIQDVNQQNDIQQ